MGEKLSREQLVERARERVFDASDLPGVEEPEHRRALTFPELVAHSKGRAKRAAPDDPELSRCREAVRHVLGSEATDERVEELTLRSLANRMLSGAMNFRPEECAQAPVDGEGVELLQTPGRAAIGAFVHASPFPVGIYGLPKAAGRHLFLPGMQLPEKPPILRQRQVHAEELGLRFITEPPLVETVLALLDAGEICAFAADQPGPSEARFFGAPVGMQTTTAVLALRTGYPVLIGTPWHDDQRFGIHMSRPIDPKGFSSPLELHQAILAEVERALDGDFTRFVGPLQAADPAAAGAVGPAA